jgi:hypothetical protein
MGKYYRSLVVVRWLVGICLMALTKIPGDGPIRPTMSLRCRVLSSIRRRLLRLKHRLEVLCEPIVCPVTIDLETEEFLMREMSDGVRFDQH